MQRTSLMLPTELKTRAASRARRAGISFGRFVRTSIEEKLNRTSDDVVASGRDPFFAFDAIVVTDGPNDMARNHDAHLHDE